MAIVRKEGWRKQEEHALRTWAPRLTVGLKGQLANCKARSSGDAGFHVKGEAKKKDTKTTPTTRTERRSKKKSSRDLRCKKQSSRRNSRRRRREVEKEVIFVGRKTGERKAVVRKKNLHAVLVQEAVNIGSFISTQDSTREDQSHLVSSRWPWGRRLEPGWNHIRFQQELQHLLGRQVDGKGAVPTSVGVAASSDTHLRRWQRGRWQGSRGLDG